MQLHGIPLYPDTVTSLLLMAIISHCKQGCTGYLCHLSFWTCGSVSVELISRSWMPGSQGACTFIFDGYLQIVFPRIVIIYTPINNAETACCPTLSPTRVIIKKVWSMPSKAEMVTWCSFYWYFSSCNRAWTSFLMLSSHLYVFFVNHLSMSYAHFPFGLSIFKKIDR